MYRFEHFSKRIVLSSNALIHAYDTFSARLPFQFMILVMAHLVAYGAFALQPNLPNAGVTIFDTKAPTLGLLVAPAVAVPGMIQVTYSGVNDGNGSGISQVELWAKPDSRQTWAATGQTRSAGSATFSYMVPANETRVRFALRTRDVAGNLSAMPTGNGTATTIVQAPNIEAIHVFLGAATAAINEVASVGVDLASTTSPDRVSFEVHFDSEKLAFVSGYQARLTASSEKTLSIGEPSPGTLSITVTASGGGGIQNGRMVDLSLTVLPVAEPPEVLSLEGTSVSAIISGQSPETATISDGAINVTAKSVPASSWIGLIILAAMLMIVPCRRIQ